MAQWMVQATVKDTGSQEFVYITSGGGRSMKRAHLNASVKSAAEKGKVKIAKKLGHTDFRISDVRCVG